MVIRQPTTEAEALTWWRRAIADPRTPRSDGDPQPGFFKKKHFGNWVPVEIRWHSETDMRGELTEPEVLVAHSAGEYIDPLEVWTWCKPIPREEYDTMIERSIAAARAGENMHTRDHRVAPTLPPKG